MRLAAIATALAGVLTCVGLVANPAAADCGWVREVQVVNGMIHVHFEQRCGGETGGSHASNAAQPPRDSDWDAVCVRSALAVGADPAEFCDVPPEQGQTAFVPTLTPGMVARAFRNIELPASELVVQPPGGETLVNFATNFYTEQGSFTRTVRLLGRRVDLRITPSRYTWVFGDGASTSGSSPGAAYPDLLVTHEYASKGGVRPRVDITYSATYRVDGGAWRDVNGTVTIPGRPVGLMVRTARPVLVSYH